MSPGCRLAGSPPPYRQFGPKSGRAASIHDLPRSSNGDICTCGPLRWAGMCSPSAAAHRLSGRPVGDRGEVDTWRHRTDLVPTCLIAREVRRGEPSLPRPPETGRSPDAAAAHERDGGSRTVCPALRPPSAQWVHEIPPRGAWEVAPVTREHCLAIVNANCGRPAPREPPACGPYRAPSNYARRAVADPAP